MNGLASSECSSGCESGWTLYLEHSFLDQNASRRGTHFMGEDDDDDGFYDEKSKGKKAKSVDNAGEEEDLSMVSDASSGPPHLPEDESYFNAQDSNNNGCFYPASSKATKLAQRSKKKQKAVIKENQRLQDRQHLPSFLDDTASSPVFDFSMNNVTVTNQQTSTESMLDYSQGFSATYFEGRSSLQDHYGFLQPHLSENEVHDKNRWYGGKGMGMM